MNLPGVPSCVGFVRGMRVDRIQVLLGMFSRPTENAPGMASGVRLSGLTMEATAGLSGVDCSSTTNASTTFFRRAFIRLRVISKQFAAESPVPILSVRANSTGEAIRSGPSLRQSASPTEPLSTVQLACLLAQRIPTLIFFVETTTLARLRSEIRVHPSSVAGKSSLDREVFPHDE